MILLVLKRLTIRGFRGFKSFSVPFKPFTVIVGPNNAGKSTLISSLRSGSLMLAHAKRFNPTSTNQYRGERYRTYLIPANSFLTDNETLRNEFERSQTTSFEIEFDGAAKLYAVWPPEEDVGFFFTKVDEGQPANLTRTRQIFPALGVTPGLRPVEPREKILDINYVRKNVGGRLSSLHFRNQLLFLDQWSQDPAKSFDAFNGFCETWLPEIAIQRPRVRDDEIDVFYKEGRREREISWSGDGFQVFLQVLLSVFLLRDSDTLVLDEPELYLHPDLQRRLVELLKETTTQCVLATHSPEIITSSPPNSVTWIDRTLKRAILSPTDETLDELTDSIGTGFNLRLARLMRSRVAFFVEGDDIQFLKPLAKKLDLRSLIVETGVAVVPLDGSGNYTKLESFDWISENFLKGSIKAFALFDRDYLSLDTQNNRTQLLNAAGIEVHFWKRHEMESYLLVPSAIARIIGVEVSTVLAELGEITDAMRTEVLTGMVNSRFQEGARGVMPGNYVPTCEAEIARYWSDSSERLKLCPAKEILSKLNFRLQTREQSTVSFKAIANTLRPGEIDDEVKAVLNRVQILSM